MPLRPFDGARDRARLLAWAGDPETRAWLVRYGAPVGEGELDGWGGVLGESRWTLEREGMMVAYGEIWEETGAGHVEVARLIVDPARRREGVGSDLVAALAGAARARRPDRPVYVRVAPDHRAALLAYPAAGLVALEPLPGELDASYLWLTWPEGEPEDPGGLLDDEA
jgi:GNAT superfamily N-acetyltransferase